MRIWNKFLMGSCQSSTTAINWIFIQITLSAHKFSYIFSLYLILFILLFLWKHSLQLTDLKISPQIVYWNILYFSTQFVDRLCKSVSCNLCFFPWKRKCNLLYHQILFYHLPIRIRLKSDESSGEFYQYFLHLQNYSNTFHSFLLIVKTT